MGERVSEGRSATAAIGSARKKSRCRSERESGLEFALLGKFDVAVTTAIVVAPVCRSCCSTSSASVTFLL